MKQTCDEIDNEIRKVMLLYLNKQSYLYFRTYREHQANQSGLVEKLVSGKLGKQQFIDQEGAIVKKKDECLEKMNSILAHLRSLQRLTMQFVVCDLYQNLHTLSYNKFPILNSISHRASNIDSTRNVHNLGIKIKTLATIPQFLYNVQLTCE